MPSLCESCEHVRVIRTARSTFLLCQLSGTNPAFPKYPPQPVVRCDGYRLTGEGEPVNHSPPLPPPAVDVRLRPVEPGDLTRMFEIQLDPEANRMAVTNPRSAEVFDAHWAASLADPHVSARAILLGEEVVGIVSCFPREGQDHVGYWIDRAHWGKGIASRALQLLLSEVTKRPLTATAATSNAASLRILQKCGFVVVKVHHSPATDRYPACELAVLELQ